MARLRIKAGNSRYRGTAVVEAALVFPLLLLLTMGAIQYGWLFLKAQQITNATRQSARLAIRPDSTNAEVLAVVDSLMASGGMSGSGYAVDFTPPDIEGLTAGQALEVKITVPSASVVLINAGFLPVPANLTAVVTMTKEGP
ncbi:MAG: pilus assembly protein [Sedimentisphaerales bacterium]|nr:pilus assembly protein [Sedimentisphaerales bacterium]